MLLMLHRLTPLSVVQRSKEQLKQMQRRELPCRRLLINVELWSAPSVFNAMRILGKILRLIIQNSFFHHSCSHMRSFTELQRRVHVLPPLRSPAHNATSWNVTPTYIYKPNRLIAVSCQTVSILGSEFRTAREPYSYATKRKEYEKVKESIQVRYAFFFEQFISYEQPQSSQHFHFAWS